MNTSPDSPHPMNPSPQEGGATPRTDALRASFHPDNDPTFLRDLALSLCEDLESELTAEKKFRGALEAFVNLWERRGWDMTMPEVAQARALLSTQGGPTT